MTRVRPLRMITYRRHRLQVFDEGLGWAVRIHAPSGGAFRPAELATARPDGLDALMREAMALIDAAEPSRPDAH